MCQFAYAPALLDLVGLGEGRFPSLVPPGTIIGELTSDAAQATGLRAGLPVVAGAGDGQCAGLGAAITEEGGAYLNLGTAITLGRHAETYRTSLAFRTLSSPMPGFWTLEAVVTSGAMSLTWFGQQVAGDDSEGADRRLQDAASTVEPGSDGLLFLPYLTRAETPYWDEAARGAWVGLRERHGLAHMYRAILEGIAFEFRMLLRAIDSELGVVTRGIRAMGGDPKAACGCASSRTPSSGPSKSRPEPRRRHSVPPSWPPRLWLWAGTGHRRDRQQDVEGMASCRTLPRRTRVASLSPAWPVV